MWWAPVETQLHNNWVQVGGAVVLAVVALAAEAVAGVTGWVRFVPEVAPAP